MDLASLGLTIDSRPAVQAAADLDKLTGAARGTENAANSLGTSAAKSTSALKQTAEEASRAALGLGTHTKALNDNARAAGLSYLQFEVLKSSVLNFTDSVIAGQSPLKAFTQQSVQAAAAVGDDGLSGLAKRAAVSVSGIVSGATAAATGIGLMGAAVLAAGTALAAAVAAQQSYASTQQALAQNLAGIGRASGVTIGQINAIAPAAAAAGNVSVRTAREMAGQFASTSKIGAEMYVGLVGSAKDYAATTGQDLPDATKALAEAFADPANGADALNKQLGFLNDTTRENIQRLAAQGDRLGAQRVLLDAYKTGLTSATELTSGWGRVTSAVGVIISDTWDKAGRAVDRVATGGDLETRLATARNVLANSQVRESYLPFGIGAGDTSAAQAEVRRLEAEVARRAQLSAQAQQNRTSTEIGNTVRDLNPNTERLKAVEDSAKKIRDNLTKLPLDEQGEARRAMDGLTSQAAQLRKDMAAGGSEFADGVRNAQFGLRSVGNSQAGQGLADVNKRAEDARIALDRTNPNPSDRLAQLASIEQTRRLEEERVRTEATRNATTSGGAFSRLSAEIQAQILDAVKQFPRLDPAIVAGVIEKESGGRPTGYTRVLNAQGQPSTTAFGLGQITVGAEQDIQKVIPGFDRKDPSQQVLGTAAYLNMRIERAGGNVTRGLDGYGTGPGYGTDILRRAGRLGDASDAGVARDMDASTRARQAEQAEIANATVNLGRNGQAYDATARANQQLQELQARGVVVTNDLRASVLGFANDGASAAQKLKLVQFYRDSGFERDQLGRDRYDTQAFARARAVTGDTTSASALQVIEETRSMAILSDARSTFSDVFGGVTSDLRRGASAAQVASSALGRLADKLLSTFTDNLTSSVFGSIAKGSSSGGFLSSLFGGGGGGSLAAADSLALANVPITFATGGIMTNRGTLPLNTYANGGIATSPQLAMFGEGRGPEAYVPLPDGKRIPVAMSGPANSNGFGPQAIDNSRTYSIDARGAQAGVADQITAALRAYDAETQRTQFERRDMARLGFG